MSHTHREGGPVCDLPTKKACDERLNEAYADAQVKLAARVVGFGPERLRYYRLDRTSFGQLVHILSGSQAELEGSAPWTNRLRRALARYRAQVTPGDD